MIDEQSSWKIWILSATSNLIEQTRLRSTSFGAGQHNVYVGVLFGTTVLVYQDMSKFA